MQISSRLKWFAGVASAALLVLAVLLWGAFLDFKHAKADAQLADAIRQQVAESDSLMRMSLVFALFAVTLSCAVILFSMLTVRQLRLRIAPLHTGAKMVAGGDLSHRITLRGNDEFTELARSINLMTDSLQSHTEALRIENLQRKNTEKNLAKLNQDFVTFLENTSDFIFFKDENSRFRFCSQALARITGHPSWRDMVGKYDAQVFPKDLAQIYQGEELSIFRDGTPVLNKIDPYYKASGEQGWVSVSIWPSLNPMGKVVGLFGIGRDITADKLLQETLRKSEGRFRDLFDKNSSVMFLMDALTGEITDVNQAAVHYFGYPRARLMGMSISSINTTPVEHLREHRLQVLRDECTHFEFPYRLASGQMRDVEVYATPIEGESTTQLHCIVHDITERKQAQEKLLMSDRKLQLAASVFAHVNEGISITDADGTILDVNEAFSRVTGYSHEEAVGKNQNMLSSGRQSKEYYASMWTDLTSKGHWSGEIWNKRKNGEAYAEQLTITAVPGTVLGARQYIALFSDITQRKLLEEQVLQLAFYDPLTGLANRRLLNDRLSQTMLASLRSGSFGALIFLDLDNFKPLNDTHGHGVGDALLVEVASRLKGCVREMDTVSRFGGDEFVVLLSELDAERGKSRQQVRSVAEKIRLALAQPYVLTVKHEDEADAVVEHHCTASIGVALFMNHDSSQQEVLKHADAAMYRAKAQGRNRIQFHNGDD